MKLPAAAPTSCVRATESVDVDQFPLLTLKISTVGNGLLEAKPPAKRTRFPKPAAASCVRATLNEAVVWLTVGNVWRWIASIAQFEPKIDNNITTNLNFKIRPSLRSRDISFEILNSRHKNFNIQEITENGYKVQKV
jgi:hypothetical protein